MPVDQAQALPVKVGAALCGDDRVNARSWLQCLCAGAWLLLPAAARCGAEHEHQEAPKSSPAGPLLLRHDLGAAPSWYSSRVHCAAVLCQGLQHVLLLLAGLHRPGMSVLSLFRDPP